MIHDERIIAESKKRYALQTERNAFLDGVQYCEDNPAWRMCEDELPYSNEEVFVVFENGDHNGTLTSENDYTSACMLFPSSDHKRWDDVTYVPASKQILSYDEE